MGFKGPIHVDCLYRHPRTKFCCVGVSLHSCKVQGLSWNFDWYVVSFNSLMQRHYTMRVSRSKLQNVYVLDVVQKHVVECLLINIMIFWFDVFKCEGVQRIDAKSEHVMLINCFPMVWCVSLTSTCSPKITWWWESSEPGWWYLSPTED